MNREDEAGDNYERPGGGGRHGSGHTHGHGKTMGTTRLILAIVFNALITAAEFVAGLITGSLSLLADAAHNLNDTASMGVSLVARRISGRDANRRRTFGYDRAELIGAFINLITLILIALYLLVEAVRRFFNPQTIAGDLMIIVGAITLAANVATALVLYKPSKGSLNIKSAFIHIVADAMGSAAVMLGGWLIMSYGWTIVDPILTIAIAGYILAQSYKMLRETISIFMETAPKDFDFDEMIRRITAMEGVQNVHHVHLWRLDENRVALEAHVCVARRDLDEMERIKDAVKRRLRDDYGVSHATLEFEFEKRRDHKRTVIADE